jgi:hypothetical protein
MSIYTSTPYRVQASACGIAYAVSELIRSGLFTFARHTRLASLRARADAVGVCFAVRAWAALIICCRAFLISRYRHVEQLTEYSHVWSSALLVFKMHRPLGNVVLAPGKNGQSVSSLHPAVQTFGVLSSVVRQYLPAAHESGVAPIVGVHSEYVHV